MDLKTPKRTTEGRLTPMPKKPIKKEISSKINLLITI
jgi:hypothetical protein